jgi:uncharacterized protein (DUF488 family)
MEIYTTGFAGKTAEQFFEPLKQVRVELVMDVRLNNVSQLAGFTKRSDLPYFLCQIAGIDYVHQLSLAPDAEMLKAYRSRAIDWQTYAQRYLDLIAERKADEIVDRARLPARFALLCSEPTPDKCHRRLAAEFLQDRWRDITVVHL